VHGPIAGGLLDTLPLHVAIAACELFGAVAAFGRTANLKRLTGEEWRIAGDAIRVGRSTRSMVASYYLETRSRSHIKRIVEAPPATAGFSFG
jgi:hypothetical protein